MIDASSGVKTAFLAVAASFKKSVIDILESFDFLVALWIVFSTASNSRMTAISNRPPRELTVVKGKDLRVRDPLTRRHEVERGQSLNDGIAELVTRNLDHDLLKFRRSNKPIIVSIKVPEGLSDSFSPEALEELGEFLEPDNVVSASFTKVQLDPVAIVVEGWS
jgi:hypothetical protein